MYVCMYVCMYVYMYVHHMVQPTIQQKRINECRPKIPKVGRQAFPKKLKATENIQQLNTVKVSYSCMPNLASIIKTHNNEVSKDTSMCSQKPCNCQKKTSAH